MEFVDTFDTSVMEGRHLYLFLYALPFFFKRNIPHKKDKGNHPLMHACQDHTKICSLFFSHFIGITIYGVFHLYLFFYFPFDD